MDLRRLTDRDSFEELTTLLHRAYAPLAGQGLRFAATHQSAEVTRRRAGEGECWVGEVDGRIVATITVRPPGGRHAGRAKFGQLAVLPEHKGQGLGRALLLHAEARARALGAAEIALDTAVHARELHALYARHGYRYVGPCDWRPHVDYLSIEMAKDLARDAAPQPLPPGWDRSPDDAWRDRGDAVRGVFGRVWPRLPERIDLAGRLGYPWREVSTAYLVEDAAHVGVLEFAAILDGRRIAVAGVHAVGTAPEARGRGLGRLALERALRHVDERVGTAVLTTSIPDWFAPFGFRVVPEHRFRVRDRLAVGTGPPLRRLSAEVPEDVALVKRALERRTPASHRLAVQELGWFFVIDEVLAFGGFGTLWAADDLDLVVSWKRDGDRALILDLVGRELPPFAEIAARLPADVGGIDLAFGPDRLDVATDPVPDVPDGDVLMVRGDWPIAGPLALPFHARC